MRAGDSDAEARATVFEEVLRYIRDGVLETLLEVGAGKGAHLGIVLIWDSVMQNHLEADVLREGFRRHLS
jgi:hypothetical protein